jgi:hypothetical protein
VPELTPDPVADTLARFTPDASAIDPAVVLFRAGQASARARVGTWKLAVAGLLLTNLVAVGWLTLRDWLTEPNRYPAPPAVVDAPVVTIVVPVPVEPATQPSPAAPESPSPYSLGALLRTTDPDQLPKTEPAAGMVPAGPPLTPLAVRDAKLD